MTMTDVYRAAVTRTICSFAKTVGLAWAMRQLEANCGAVKFDDVQTEALASEAVAIGVPVPDTLPANQQDDDSGPAGDLRVVSRMLWKFPCGSLRASESSCFQAARSRCVVSRGRDRVSQPSTLRIWICPEARSAQSNIGTVSAQGSTVCVLMRRRNSSFRRSMALVVRADFHCEGSRRVKVKSIRLDQAAFCVHVRSALTRALAVSTNLSIGTQN